MSWDELDGLLEGDRNRYERLACLAAWLLHSLGPVLEPWLQFAVANGYRLARSRKALQQPRSAKGPQVEATFRNMPGVRAKR